MGLYALTGWGIAFYAAGLAVLGLLMVEAMMQYTAALLARRPGTRRASPASADALRAALLDLRGERFVIQPAGKCGLAVRWDVTGGRPVAEGTRLKITATWSTRILLDERRREARWYESVRTSSVFVGFDGFRPRLTFGWSYQGGYLSGLWTGMAHVVREGFPPKVIESAPFEIDTDLMRRDFVRRVNAAGWTFRPVTLPFYASTWWLWLTERIVPDRLAGLDRRRLWRVVYPASYALLVAFILAPLDSVGISDLGIVALVSVVWWSVWWLLAWLLSARARRS